MERFVVDPQRIETITTWAKTNNPQSAEPLPGSNLKVGDQVLWLDFCRAQVIWGGTEPTTFVGYSPLDFGDFPADLPAGDRGSYFDDRAPVDPQESPFPIYPEDPPPEPQQQQSDERGHGQQMGGHTQHGARRGYTLEQAREAVKQLLERLPEEHREKARAAIHNRKPEYLEHEHHSGLGDHRHGDVPGGHHER